MNTPLPPDDVLEAMFLDLEEAAASAEPVDTEALATRHGVPRELVENCLASLQILTAEATPGDKALDRLGPYELLGVLGRGGIGAVYRARHPDLDREVALKVLRSGEQATPHERARFLREAEALAALRHPNVLTIHDAGQAATGGYLVLELVEDARTITQAGASLDWRGRVALARDAARGLGYAHTRGVVHRDVKPENLLVDPQGRVRVSDFGLARLARAERLTQTGALLGTVGYMAPEQARGDVARQGPPSDVWGLGAVLYELLSGEPLFPEAERLTLLNAQPAVTLRRADPSLPPALDAVCRRALDLDPAARYPHGDALADDLEAVLAGRRPPGVAAAQVRLWIGGLVLLAGVAVAATVGPRDPPPSPPPVTPSGDREPLGLSGPQGSAPWRDSAHGPPHAGDLLAAWRWVRANPSHPRAHAARTFLSEGRRAPLCLLEHDRARDPVGVAFDGNETLLTFGAGTLRRWATPSGNAVSRLPVRGLHEGRSLPGGDWILVGAHGVERWPGGALRDGDPSPLAGPLGTPAHADRGATWVAPLPGSPSGPCEIAPDGDTIAVPVGRSGVALVAAADGARRTLGKPGDGVPRRIAFAANDRLVVAREREGSGYSLELWDLTRERLLTARPVLAVSALAPLPERHVLALGSHRGSVSLRDLTTLDPQGDLRDPALENVAGSWVFRGDEAVGQLTPLPHARAVLALPGRDVLRADRRLKWLNLASGEGGPITPPLAAPASALAVSPEGALVAIGRRDGRVEVWLLPASPP